MPNLRIIHINRADQATSLSAGSTAGSLVAAYMQTDRKGEAHRSVGTSVSYALTWTDAVSIGAVALPATNLGVDALMRVRLYSDTARTVLLADSGAQIACPGLTPGPWTWPGVLNANAFAYGGAAKACVWFATNYSGVKGMTIDLSDATNPAGYIDCARIVAGPWWSPEWNAGYGGTTTVVDTTQNERTDAGDLLSDRAPMHQELSIKLPLLPEADRSQLTQIMRANGVWKPVFLSLVPAKSSAAEQDHMVYGKRKAAPVGIDFINRYSSGLDIESW